MNTGMWIYTAAQHTRERGMWESIAHELVDASWPRFVVLIGSALYGIYLWRKYGRTRGN